MSSLFDEDEDDFSGELASASSAFITMDMLLGRLLLVRPTGVLTKISAQPGSAGQPYPVYVCNVAVLSGEITELIDDIPMELPDFQLWGQNISGQLQPKYRKKALLVGTLIKRPTGRHGWIFSEASEGDLQTARDFLSGRSEAKAKEAVQS